MKEAAEIAKLRLFLKLASCAEVDYRKDNFGLEALPDIDFNIRAGNSLVGFANYDEVKDAVEHNTLSGQMNLLSGSVMDVINEKAQMVSLAYKRFRECQDKNTSHEALISSKHDLQERLTILNDKLNQYMAKKYGIDVKNQPKDYEKWLLTHEPFNWFVEFYDVIHNRGGFDVIIGNPPYVEYTKVKNTYAVKNYQTEKCANLYPFCIERSIKLLHKNAIISMIIPISAFANQSMVTFQNYIKQFNKMWLSNFHQRPAALFDGVLQRLSIFIIYNNNNENEQKVYTTGITRWYSDYRESLFTNMKYYCFNQTIQPHFIKVESKIERQLADKFYIHNQISNYINSNKNNNYISYRTAGGGYWVTFLNSLFETQSLSNKIKCFREQYNAKVFSAILNSNLFWWYYSTNYDLFNFKDYMIFSFRFNYPNKYIEKELITLSDELENNLLSNAIRYTINSKTRGANITINYNKPKSKYIMDKIDKVLAKHYGFTEEELDYIINYDIKYRMGDALNGDDNDTE